MINSEYVDIGEPIEFSADGLVLRGRLHLPAVPHPPFVVGSHGLFSNGDSPKQLSLARELNTVGIAFFRFDHRGCGQSAGRLETDTSLAARCADLRCAVETLQRRSDLSTRFGLFGSSFGGAVCLSLAPETTVSALVVNAAPVRSRSLNEGEITAGGPAGIDGSFYRENLQFDVSEKLSAIRTVCVFHGSADRVVPVENGMEIFERAGDPKKIAVFEGGDHRMSRVSDQRRFVREAVAWFCRHLVD